jgi:hypothetical protein
MSRAKWHGPTTLSRSRNTTKKVRVAHDEVPSPVNRNARRAAKAMKMKVKLGNK